MGVVRIRFYNSLNVLVYYQMRQENRTKRCPIFPHPTILDIFESQLNEHMMLTAPNII